MNNNYSLQWFNIKAEGLITVFFLMGLCLHAIVTIYPIGIVIMILAAFLLFIDIIIFLEDKARRSKRGW